MPWVVGIVDTTFARVDMARYAIEVLTQHIPDIKIVRYTVPGVKDIPIAAKKVLNQADIAMTFAWIGPSLVDKLSYLAASMGLIIIQILTEKHIIDVSVHEDEAENDEELLSIAMDRAKKHAINVVYLLTRGSQALTPYAGKGLRQGLPDKGPIR